MHVEFASSHHGEDRRYRVRLTGPLHVEYLHPRYGWRESINTNTRDIARRVLAAQLEVQP